MHTRYVWRRLGVVMLRAAKVAAAVALAAAVAVPMAVAGRRPARSAPPPPPGAGELMPDMPTGRGDVTRLTQAMRRSVRRTAAAAAADGVELWVTSGWRSRQHQQRLFDAAVVKYGSADRARQWVLPPNESAHVRGAAVDVGPEAGAQWMRANGERFGLCQRYANESWHFERLAGPKGSKCPRLEAHP